MAIELRGNGSVFNADDNGLVTCTCPCGYVVRSRERVPGEIIPMIDIKTDGGLRVFSGGFEIPAEGLKCDGCGDWVWKITVVDDTKEGEKP